MDNFAKTIQTFDETAEDYQKNTDNLAPTKLLDKFVNCLPKQAKVLDVGCGPGRDADYLQKQGLEIFGVDASQKMIELARQRNKEVSFEVMDMRELNFAPKNFDGVWASASVFFVDKETVKKVFAKIKEIMKKDGILFVSVKEGEGEIFSPDDRYGGRDKFYAYYQEAEIKGLLEAAGFEIIDSSKKEASNKYQRKTVWINIFCKF